MKKINYWELLKKSFFLFFKNLVLLVPVLVSIVLFIGLGIVVVIEGLVFFGLNSVFLHDPSVMFSGFNLVLFIFFVLVDIILMMWIGAYVRGMTIGMLKEIVDTGKTSVNKMFYYGKKYFEIYFKYIILRLLIYLVPLIVLGALGFLAFTASMVFGIILAVFLSLIYLAYVIFVSFGLFFMDPMITSKNKPIGRIIKDSFHYLKKDFWHMFCTWGISILVAIVVGVVMVPFSIGPTLIEQFGLAGLFFGVIYIFSTLIRTIVNIILKIWLDIFVFQSYFAKNK